jgi:alpha-D-ribose 1-methylphosphonate 5-triphosphate synthase subunit PhnL
LFVSAYLCLVDLPESLASEHEKEDTDMLVLFARCCGLDVHLKTVVACVMITQANGKVDKSIRTFATTTAALLARTAGRQDTRALADVLVTVGLSGRAGDRVKTYSLGMKQRLAIAAALLNSPQLIFLDEPTNRLDPAGTVEIRELIGQLGASGHTIFLFSHLLHEVEQVCNERLRSLVHRRLKPRSPLACPLCCRSSAHLSGQKLPPLAVRPWREIKSRRGAPKRVTTEGFACPNGACQYGGITDAQVHASSGRWHTWPY